MKKYEITKATKSIHHNDVTLHRIKALKDFKDIKKGDIGGWIQSEKNLSQDDRDDSWIGDNSIVYENAIVRDNARVIGDSIVGGNAIIEEGAIIDGKSLICGSAKIKGGTYVSNKSDICGGTILTGELENAYINSDNDYLYISNVGDYPLCAYRNECGELMIFTDYTAETMDIDTFEDNIYLDPIMLDQYEGEDYEEYCYNEYYPEYEVVCKFIRKHFDEDSKDDN